MPAVRSQIAGPRVVDAPIPVQAGVAERDPAVMTFSFTSIVAGGAILARRYATRRRFSERALVTSSG